MSLTYCLRGHRPLTPYTNALPWAEDESELEALQAEQAKERRE